MTYTPTYGSCHSREYAQGYDAYLDGPQDNPYEQSHDVYKAKDWANGYERAWLELQADAE